MPTPYQTLHKESQEIGLHRHTGAYLALVLEGTHEERSVDGRYLFGPGTLVYHPPYHSHTNRFLSPEVRVLNLEIAERAPRLDDYAAATVGDVAYLERLMHDRPATIAGAAGEILRARAKPREPAPLWLRGLARALARSEETSPIKLLAKRLGVTPEHASRRFAREFGIGPARFRRETRLRRAVEELQRGEPLAQAALAAGFADQSHMGRAFRAAFGKTPTGMRPPEPT